MCSSAATTFQSITLQSLVKFRFDRTVALPEIGLAVDEQYQ